MLPPGFERKALTFISPLPIPNDSDLSSLTKEQSQAFELVQRQGKVSLKEMLTFFHEDRKKAET